MGKTIVDLKWEADYKRQAGVFEVRLSNSDLEWIGIGFSDHGEFNNSDLCIFQQGKLRVR